MSSYNNIGINIKELPPVDLIQTGDSIIVETPDGTGIIDYENIQWSVDNMLFKDEYNAALTQIDALSAQYTALSSSLYTDIQAEILRDVAVFKNVSSLSANQTMEGTLVKIPFNYIEVNNISSQQSIIEEALAVCSDVTVSQTASAFVFDKGTYKTFISMNVTSLCSTPTWMQAYLYQDTSPIRVMQHGSAFYSNGQYSHGTLTINGYFYLCRTSQVTLRVDTYGRFALGMPYNSIYATTTASPISATLTAMLATSACNVSMYIEKVSDTELPNINQLSTRL